MQFSSCPRPAASCLKEINEEFIRKKKRGMSSNTRSNFELYFLVEQTLHELRQCYGKNPKRHSKYKCIRHFSVHGNYLVPVVLCKSAIYIFRLILERGVIKQTTTDSQSVWVLKVPLMLNEDCNWVFHFYISLLCRFFG